mmetsp:Transcript_10190/g.41279  ORF Transcript_10190/g.41279 Transcript_10190/m.41279 type:complete len:357 (+) Transcript_10190:1054-2124(+)
MRPPRNVELGRGRVEPEGEDRQEAEAVDRREDGAARAEAVGCEERRGADRGEEAVVENAVRGVRGEPAGLVRRRPGTSCTELADEECVQQVRYTPERVQRRRCPRVRQQVPRRREERGRLRELDHCLRRARDLDRAVGPPLENALGFQEEHARWLVAPRRVVVVRGIVVVVVVVILTGRWARPATGVAELAPLLARALIFRDRQLATRSSAHDRVVVRRAPLALAIGVDAHRGGIVAAAMKHARTVFEEQRRPRVPRRPREGRVERRLLLLLGRALRHDRHRRPRRSRRCRIGSRSPRTGLVVVGGLAQRGELRAPAERAPQRAAEFEREPLDEGRRALHAGRRPQGSWLRSVCEL